MRKNKPIIVREFDHIHPTDKDILQEQSSVRDGRDIYISKEDFSALKSFVEEYADYENAERPLGKELRGFFGGKKGTKRGPKDDDYETADSFFSIGKNRITIRNYVGAIQLPSGQQIDILPKVDLVDDDKEDFRKTRRIFIRMLRSITDYSYKIFDPADLKAHDMPLFEVFIYIFLKEVMRLTQIGLKSQYITEEENLKFFKGKLLLGEHIKRNAAHKERFYVGFDEYSINRPENRLIKAALEKVKRISIKQVNQKMIYQILPSFEFVEASTNVEKDFNQVRLDRITATYEGLMTWTRIILRDLGLSTFADSKHAHSILFKMNDLYEAYVYQEFRKAVARKAQDSAGDDLGSNLNWKIIKKAASEGKYLFDKEMQNDKEEKKKNKFRLEPDIMVKEDGAPVALLDTKWKALKWKKDNHGISNADMYQMFAYSQKFKCANIWLLYPRIPLKEEGNTVWPADNGKHTRVSFESESPECNVRVFFTDLEKIKDNMDELVNELVNELIGEIKEPTETPKELFKIKEPTETPKELFDDKVAIEEEKSEPIEIGMPPLPPVQPFSVQNTASFNDRREALVAAFKERNR